MLLRAILLALFMVPLAWSKEEVSFSKAVHFRIEQAGGRWRLSSKVSIKKHFINLQATSDTDFEFAEYPHTTITNIRAEYRGQVLDPRQISFYYPQARDVFIDSSRIHRVAFPAGLKSGDSVAITYDETYEDLAFLPMIRIPAINRVSRFEISVAHPKDCRVEFQIASARETIMATTERPDEMQTRLVFQNLPQVSNLHADPFRRAHGWVIIKVTREDVPLTPFTPAAFTKWYLDLLAPTSVVDERMKSLLANEIRGASTQREKARVLFDYVKSQIRYIADEGSGHAFLPHACTEVLEKKWGDCKDKARLLTVLGKLHNLPIHMVLLSTDPAPEFEEVSLGLFNHAICVLEADGELLFMDPTASKSELGDLPDADMLARALILNPRNPRYAVIQTRDVSRPDVDFALACDPERPGAAKAKIQLRHAWRMRFLQAREELRDRDFEKYAVDRLEHLLPKLLISNVRLVGDSRKELSLEAQVDVSDFLVVTDMRVYMPSAPFRAFDPAFLEREKDGFVVEASGPDHYRLQVELQGQGIHSRQERVTLGKEGSPRLIATTSPQLGPPRATFTFEQPFRKVPNPMREAFIIFCSDYARSGGNLLTFERKQP